MCIFKDVEGTDNVTNSFGRVSRFNVKPNSHESSQKLTIPGTYLAFADVGDMAQFSE
jgi:hypothetical protein